MWQGLPKARGVLQAAGMSFDQPLYATRGRATECRAGPPTLPSEQRKRRPLSCQGGPLPSINLPLCVGCAARQGEVASVGWEHILVHNVEVEIGATAGWARVVTISELRRAAPHNQMSE